MTVTLDGTTIEISGGVFSAVVSSATDNSINVPGPDFTAYRDRIVYITDGTGAGQSRGIRFAGPGSFTIWGTWDTVPDATSSFVISHDVTDLTALAGADYVGDPRSKAVSYAAGDIKVLSGGVFGGLRNTLMLTGDRNLPLVDVGGLWQFGYQVGDYGAQGGTLMMTNHASYLDWNIDGRFRLYGCDWTVFMHRAPSIGGQTTRPNLPGEPEEFTLIGCRIQDVNVYESATSTIVNCSFHGPRGGVATKNAPIRSFGNKFFSGQLSPRTSEGNPNGVDFFDLLYLGDDPQLGILDAPVFLFAYNRPDGVVYYWNTAFKNGFANSFTWYGNSVTGVLYEGYSVRPIVRDAAGVPLSGIHLALIDKDGNAGWTVSKDAAFDPVKALSLVTDSHGTINTPAIGENENGLVVRSVWSRLDGQTSQSVDYYPFNLRARGYGYLFLSKPVDYTTRTDEPISLVADLLVAASEATAAAYTGVTIDPATSEISFGPGSADTFQKFYDYSRKWCVDNIDEAVPFTRAGASVLLADGWTVIDPAYAGAVTWSGGAVRYTSAGVKSDNLSGCVVEYDVAGGAVIHTGALSDLLDLRNLDAAAISVSVPTGTSYTTANNTGGAIAVTETPITFQIAFPNWLDGTRYQVFNTTQGAELVNAVVAGGAGMVEALVLGTDYEPGDILRVRSTYCQGLVAKEATENTFQPGAEAGAVLVPEVQTDHAIYNALGVEGSTVTKFAADYINTEIDIVVGSDFTLDELFAWYVFNMTSENGIRLFFGAVTALDQANFVIDVSKADMLLDNLTAAMIIQNDIRRISRSDGLYPVKRPTTGGGGIDVRWRPDVLIAETGVSGLTPQESALLAEIANIKAKTDALPASPADEVTLAAVKARTDNLPDDPASAGDVEDAAFL
jgi:hypothetical protein